MLKLKLYDYLESEEEYTVVSNLLFKNEDEMNKHIDEKFGGKVRLPFLSEKDSKNKFGFREASMIGCVETYEDIFHIEDQNKRFAVGLPVVNMQSRGHEIPRDYTHATKMLESYNKLSEDNLLYTSDVMSAIRMNIIQLCYRITEKYKSMDAECKQGEFQYIIQIKKDFEGTLDYRAVTLERVKKMVDNLSIFIYDDKIDRCSLFDIVFNSSDIAKECMEEIKKTIIELY